MNTPRALTVLLHAPDHVPDKDVATKIWQLLTYATRNLSGERRPADPETIEVHACTINPDEDEWLRRSVFGNGVAP